MEPGYTKRAVALLTTEPSFQFPCPDKAFKNHISSIFQCTAQFSVLLFSSHLEHVYSYFVCLFSGLRLEPMTRHTENATLWPRAPSPALLQHYPHQRNGWKCTSPVFTPPWFPSPHHCSHDLESFLQFVLNGHSQGVWESVLRFFL